MLAIVGLLTLTVLISPAAASRGDDPCTIGDASDTGDIPSRAFKDPCVGYFYPSNDVNRDVDDWYYRDAEGLGLLAHNWPQVCNWGGNGDAVTATMYYDNRVLLQPRTWVDDVRVVPGKCVQLHGEAQLETVGGRWILHLALEGGDSDAGENEYEVQGFL